MQNFLKNTAVSLLFLALTAGATTARAQNRIEGAVQQGQGAYVQKSTRTECITNSLLGLNGLNCLTMTQEKFMVTPSGNAMSVWQGTVPVESRPAQRLVKNATWTESNNDGVTRTYNTEAVTMPDGSIKLTLTDKQNGKGSTKGKR
ncbi:hypothetical protein ACFP2F_05600 [Hymenobacter artigasi]|uniref:Uncharacterized protein n=1 Tax=Hymenobacter artigasi TaxID=2719616 RepID=A0ABX1HEK6_9BACT|nr:hypothetical protein [Hymenobacter artigasi]NKI88334.1 hypothetical protein [Hymenobacter artigasi]